MIARRAAIALLAIAFAADVGCRSPGLLQMRLEPNQPTATAARFEPPRRDAVPGRTFTIAFATFIPANHLLAPSIHPQSYGTIFPPMRLAFAGDDRGFDVDATSYRAKQVVTVIPDEDIDADGLLEGSKQNLGGITESFDARLATADGRIHDGESADGRKLKQSEITVNTDGMIIDDPVRLGPHRVFVRLRTGILGGPRNRLIVGSPSIDWDIGITIDTSGPEPMYEVEGIWDGYPAAELYINRQAVFTFMPANEEGLCFDLLKLLPGYGDFRFVREGKAARPLVSADPGP